ncbi:hypothetical protein SUGI_1184480 [Cryptomeria japonica]|uniref:probable F-box protein At2g36090 n=1 Tax=Cryptomeria japonica TaxID=3369 RepID=UPI0024147F6D|nr:probable F-box protein At2g36090 [Cryptomeria japonica]GLJ55197.1 hypothetical protein SUGI_1184480 [Cryptomeria japonica]
MGMMSLNGDLISQILGHVDGTTLANAGCVSSEFWSIAREERIWEQVCCSLWPSIEDTGIKELISDSLGGFRNFYANCFPLIAYESTQRDSMSMELQNLNDGVPSDFVSIVDVAYKNKAIFNKVVWGILCAHDFEGWFSNCPFRMELIEFSDVEDDNHAVEDGLPTIIECLGKVKKDDKIWGELMENIRLSWIVVNRRTRKVANFSSWSPLAGQRHWVSDKDFVMRFGSILPAHNILPCNFVHCILVMKCRVSDGDQASLKISQLSMQLEDAMGGQVNGRNSLLILERALGCRKSKNHAQILVSYQQYFSEQRKLKEAKMRSEERLDTLCILSGIVAFNSICYFVFRESGAIMGL